MLTLCEFARRKNKKITLLNDTVFQEIMRAGGLFKDIFGLKSGLDIRYLPELLTQDIYVDNTASLQLLRYRSNVARQAIQDTVQSVPEHTLVKGWRKLLNIF